MTPIVLNTFMPPQNYVHICYVYTIYIYVPRFLSTPRHAVLMLGDVSKHKTNNSQEVVLENNARFFGLLRDRFSDVPVFCILGNNDLPGV